MHCRGVGGQLVDARFFGRPARSGSVRSGGTVSQGRPRSVRVLCRVRHARQIGAWVVGRARLGSRDDTGCGCTWAAREFADWNGRPTLSLVLGRNLCLATHGHRLPREPARGMSSGGPRGCERRSGNSVSRYRGNGITGRSEEHTSELQSRLHLVCRLLLEKKKKIQSYKRIKCFECTLK